MAQAYVLTGDDKYLTFCLKSLENWIDTFPVKFGYPFLIPLNISQRLVSWCIIFSLLKNNQNFKKMLPIFLASISAQSEFLFKNLSKDGVTNNFLLSEIASLRFVAKTFPNLTNSKDYLAETEEIARDEVSKQILSDGTSFEASSGYYRFVVETFVLMLSIEKDESLFKNFLKETLLKISEPIKYLSNPECKLPHIGDLSMERLFWLDTEEDILDCKDLFNLIASICNHGDFKTSKDYSSIFWFFSIQGIESYKKLNADGPLRKSILYPHGGFAVLNNGKFKEDNIHLVMDCGDIGLGGLGGHGHNDCLSFCLYMGSEPFIIDRGTYTYFSSRKDRDTFRSISSHNSIQIDSTEPALLGPGLFQIKNAYPSEITDWVCNDKVSKIDARYIYFKSGDVAILHNRKITLNDNDDILLTDEILGSDKHRLNWRFFLHPEILPEMISSKKLRLRSAKGSIVEIEVTNNSNFMWEISKTTFSPHYGALEETHFIGSSMEINLPHKIEFRISNYVI